MVKLQVTGNIKVCFGLLQNLTKDENILQELQHEVVQVYMGLQGVHPVKAEIQYMKEIQMMDGYGMEYYIAKVYLMLLYTQVP